MNKRNLLTCVLLLSTALTVSAQQRSRGQARQNAQTPRGPNGWVDLYGPHADAEMPYRLMKPMHFDANKRYAVIVSLHGGGGRGTDNRKQLRGNMKFTTWADDGHGVAEKMITGSGNGSTQLSSDRCDGEPEFLKWLFANHRASRPNRAQQDRPRKQNRGAGVSPEIIDAYEARVFKGMPYRLLLPANFEAAKTYPLILNLHGGAGVGNDNESNLRNWSATFVDAAWRAKYSCIVVTPQATGSWSVTGETVPELTEALKKTYSDAWQARLEERNYPPGPMSYGPLTKAFALIDHLAKEFAVDTKRVYVLGHSMGGFGSWNSVWAAPERFAAAIPSAGGLLPWKDPARFKHVPIWAFHGASDPVVPTGFTQEIFMRMKKVGGNLKYTELKDVKHNASQYAFSYEGDEPEKGYITQYSSESCDKTANVWDWLFTQRLDKR